MQIIVGIVAITTGMLTILGMLIKLANVVNKLQNRDDFLKGELQKLQLQQDHQIDKLELLANGLKERGEHIDARLSTQLHTLIATVADIEGFLQKHTEYERRGR